MPNIRTRLSGLVPACLMKAVAWFPYHTQLVELLILASAIGLIVLEEKLTNPLAL